MTKRNPTVTLNVTAKELAILSRFVDWNSPYDQLRTKINEAEKDMRVANREKNRLNKQERKERKLYRVEGLT